MVYTQSLTKYNRNAVPVRDSKSQIAKPRPSSTQQPPISLTSLKHREAVPREVSLRLKIYTQGQ